ncbi:MAG: type phosphodiesterase/nucleotide pyrophosphatase [Candidatus Solibacter sp.]|nr:type phosphodiesterase/nucleotide pyrophosphatase [Candidatus Solibacter sp.]
MKLTTRLKLAAVFSALLLLAVPAFSQAPAAQRMVVMISLDGFPAFALDDPKLPAPTLRRLIREGVTARMHTINPTVTWPNHTALVTGVRADEHGLLVNGAIVPTGTWPPVKVDPMVDKEKMVHAPTVYDAAHRAGLTTAQVDWVAINNAPTITWPFAEWAVAEDAVPKEMLRKGVLAPAEMENFSKANILFRDQIWAKAAAFLVREHKPNLLLVHFLSLDSVHHSYGPKTLAGTSAIAFIDSCVEKVVDAVREAGMQDRTTFFIVADHGFKGYTKEIRPAVALGAAGLTGKVYVLAEGGTADVYIEKSQIAELLPKTIQTLQSVEGIDKVIAPEGYPALGLPLPANDPQMSHLLLTAKEGYAFSGATGGPVTAAVPQTRGSHGYLASDPDMDALFIASGFGVRRGATLAPIANIDVAPTIAKLLSVPLPTAKGKPLPIQ